MAVSLSNFYVLNEPNVLPSNASTKFPGASLLASKLQICASPSTHLRNLGSVKRYSVLRSEASRKSQQLTQELQTNQMSNVGTDQEKDLFFEMKDRFLSFKRHSYMENLDHFQILAKGQAPKFMVVACADSRVCPSNILGFKPGEAFTVRSVANLVPEFESGPSETKAGLEFSVNSLEVENIFVIGHSCCGGIRALMSMQDEVDSSSFIQNWVVIGNNASLKLFRVTHGDVLDMKLQP
ncbi:hypothetical protein IFM89_026779 [Coptis chinensis]|uniref:Carbonic anhydrase n=1 Tax=Coptis chinensis TaxID=261450 RepID=A0A835HQ94_9MAGN|nr:hypothetical protein IFM89_026779 [Coptis chinensis]